MPKRPAQRPYLALRRRKLALLVAAALSGGAHASAPSPLTLPVTFERNDGQFPASVAFVAHAPGTTLLLGGGEIALTSRRAPGDSLHLRLLGANRAPEIEAAQPLPTRSHYYIGREASHRVLDVPHFGELRLKDVYPGIDLDLHARDGALEYDLLVAPGADPRDIRIDLRGAKNASIDGDGNLRLRNDGQTFVQHAPVAWQGEGAGRTKIAARFEIVEGAEGREARVAVGGYDAHAALVIDPVITYSSYVGGSSYDARSLAAADASGDIYYITQDQLLSPTPFDQVVVTRLNPVTNTIVYQTHFGGHGNSATQAFTLGGSGSSVAYVVGLTKATDYPAYPPKVGTDADAFVTVLAPNGTITASRVIGSSADDGASSVAVDASGNVYVAGQTSSIDLPITTGERLNRIGASGGLDGFVAKLDASLNTVYLRYLGGSANDYANAVAVDAAGQAVVVGATYSTDLLQSNVASPPSPPPSLGGSRAFASKLTPDGTGLVYSQYIGGQAREAVAVAIDPATGDAVIAGNILSPNLVPTSARPYAGGNDAFVIRLDASGTPTFGTLLGGSGDEGATGIGVARNGDVWLGGYTTSHDFPTVGAFAERGAALHGDSDGFVVRLHGGSPDFASYLGGSGHDEADSLAIGPDGAVYLGGYTESADFPYLNGARGALSGPSDGYITRIEGMCKRPAFAGEFFVPDGRSDLLIAPTTPDGTFQVLQMNGLRTVMQAGIGAYGDGSAPIIAGNFRGPGSSNDVLMRRADGSIEMWVLASSSIPEHPLLPAGTPWTPTHVADFNGDGMGDILWANTDGSVDLWLMNGTVQLAHSVIMPPGTGWHVAQVGDFNGDGKADILWAHDNGSVGLWLMDGFTRITNATLQPAGSAWKPVKVGDFDGDGKSDIVWTNAADGTTSLWLMNGLAPASRGPIMPAGTAWRVTAVGDFDGDGKDDLVWSNADGSVGLWLMNGLTQVARTPLQPAGSQWSVQRLTDTNGDCRADIVWSNGPSVSIWLMKGTAILQHGSVWSGGGVVK